MPIFLPSLKERREDIEQIVKNFVMKFNKKQSKKIIGATPEALTLLKRYDWPGNIRELENVIEHAFILEEGPHITVQSLPESFLLALGIDIFAPNFKSGIRSQEEDGAEDMGDDEEISGEETSGDMITISGESLDFNRHKEAFEKEFIIKALTMFKGRINQTALHANIPKKTLLRKIEKYGIVARDYADVN